MKYFKIIAVKFSRISSNIIKMKKKIKNRFKNYKLILIKITKKKENDIIS
jgi:hypothetical protein